MELGYREKQSVMIAMKLLENSPLTGLVWLGQDTLCAAFGGRSVSTAGLDYPTKTPSGLDASVVVFTPPTPSVPHQPPVQNVGILLYLDPLGHVRYWCLSYCMYHIV